MKNSKRLKIHIHPAGAALLVVALLFLPSRAVVAASAALLWHEFCHVSVMLLLGVKRCTVELTPFGGMIIGDDLEDLSFFRQMLCAMAGVAGSALGAWCCAAFLSKTTLAIALFQANLSLATVNCLPAWPLDGARAVIAAASCFGMERGMHKGLTVFSCLLGCALTALGLYAAWNGQINLSLLAAGPYLIYAAHQSTLAQKIRRMDNGLKKRAVGPFVPVKLFVSDAKTIENSLPVWMGRWEPGCCHMLCQMDENGSVAHFWTETEVWETVVAGIGAEQK